MTRERRRSPDTQSGMTLVACSLVMLGVALLTSASLRSLEDGISLTYNAVDRRVAQQSADAALHDAAMMLAMRPDQPSIAQAQGAHRIGEITGAAFSYGGYLQPYELPDYVIEVLPQPGIVNPGQAVSSAPDIYRVTARGKGRSHLTTVILQADFALQLCNKGTDAQQNPAQEAEQKTEQRTEHGAQRSTEQNNRGQSAEQGTLRSAEPDTGQGTEAHRVKCVPGVRQLAWRLLQAS